MPYSRAEKKDHSLRSAHQGCALCFRVALPNYAACNATCRAPECSEGVKLLHQRRQGECGRGDPSGKGEGSEGPPPGKFYIRE